MKSAKGDASTFRARVDTVHDCLKQRDAVVASLGDVDAVHAMASSASGTIRAGERKMDSIFSAKREAYERVAAKLAEENTRCDELQKGVSKMLDACSSAEAEAAELLEQVQARGHDLGDSNRLVAMKRALQTLRADADGLELAIGIALQRRTAYWKRAGGPPRSGSFALEDSVDSLLTDSV